MGNNPSQGGNRGGMNRNTRPVFPVSIQTQINGTNGLSFQISPAVPQTPNMVSSNYAEKPVGLSRQNTASPVRRPNTAPPPVSRSNTTITYGSYPHPSAHTGIGGTQYYPSNCHPPERTISKKKELHFVKRPHATTNVVRFHKAPIPPVISTASTPATKAPINEPTFHCTQGKNVEMVEDRKCASRKDGEVDYALVFSSNPMKVNDKISFQITKVKSDLAGSVRIGVLHDCMRRLGSLCWLPKHLCPEFTDEDYVWGDEVPSEHARLNNIITLELAPNGTAIIYVNGINKGVFLRDIDVKKTLHFVADICGTTTAIKLTDFPHDLAIEITKQDNMKHDPKEPEKYLLHFCKQHDIDTESATVDSDLYFLPTNRTNLSLSNENKVITLKDDPCPNSTFVFIETPLSTNMSFLFESMVGGFMIGVTHCDPSTLQETNLPLDQSQLWKRSDYWIFNEAFYFLGNSKYFAITLKSDGEIQFDCELSTQTETVLHADTTHPLHLFFIFVLPDCTVKTVGILKHEPDLPSGIDRAMYREHLLVMQAIQKEQKLKQEHVGQVVAEVLGGIRLVSPEESNRPTISNEQSTIVKKPLPVTVCNQGSTSSENDDSSMSSFHDAPSEFTTNPKALVQSHDQTATTSSTASFTDQSIHFTSITKPMTADQPSNTSPKVHGGSTILTNNFLSMASNNNQPSTSYQPSHQQPSSLLDSQLQPTAPKLIDMPINRQTSVSSTRTLSLTELLEQPQSVMLCTNNPSLSNTNVENLLVDISDNNQNNDNSQNNSSHNGHNNDHIHSDNNSYNNTTSTENEVAYASQDSNDTECVVCFDNTRSIAFNPCGHYCVCLSCWEGQLQHDKKCPMCRRLVETILKIFPA